MIREAPKWFVAELRRLDERLRCRWDTETRCFVVEQWVPRLGYYWHVVDLVDAHGSPLEPGEWALEYLRYHDMWQRRGGWKAYIHQRDRDAKRSVESRQRHASDERVAAVADQFTFTNRFVDETKLVV